MTRMLQILFGFWSISARQSSQISQSSHIYLKNAKKEKKKKSVRERWNIGLLLENNDQPLNDFNGWIPSCCHNVQTVSCLCCIQSGPEEQLQLLVQLTRNSSSTYVKPAMEEYHFIIENRNEEVYAMVVAMVTVMYVIFSQFVGRIHIE